MKRGTFRKTLGVLLVSITAVIAVFWGQISESFGPMKLIESQCLICHRNRVEKWVCGSKANDSITENAYSGWMDTFTPSDHQHVWMCHSSCIRTRWFGHTAIACGGIPTIPRIFEQRQKLGESKAQQLAVRFQKLIRGDSSPIDLTELDSFTKAVVDDPESLLQTARPN